MSQPQPATASIPSRDSRRTFLKQTALFTSAAAAVPLALGRSAHAAGDDTLKLGLN